MKKIEKIDPEQNQMGQREKIGESGYLNENCWLAKTLNYSPAKRCQYCALKFRNCLFLQYGIISLILVLFFLTLSFLFEGKISKLAVIFIFILVIIYGYFFNKNTERIIKAYFAQRKAKEALEELTENLQQKVDEQTKEIKGAYKKVERAYEVEKEAKEKIEELNKAKTRFMSIVSHQLRAPLTVIKGYISMILEGSYGKMNGKIKEKLERVFQSNERLVKLIHDLLNVSRIEEGRIEIKFAKLNLEDLITDLAKELSIKIQEKGIYLKFEKPKEKLPEISADKDKISEVILNILDNATKYTPKGGITVKIQKLKSLFTEEVDKIQIIISDTGEGMTPEEIDNLFKSFSRGGAGTLSYPEGMGLGLYIAKLFVELHHGKIWAESEGKDKGSTFYIELPVK